MKFEKNQMLARRMNKKHRDLTFAPGATNFTCIFSKLIIKKIPYTVFFMKS